jgi:hypothetical protein
MTTGMANIPKKMMLPTHGATKVKRPISHFNIDGFEFEFLSLLCSELDSFKTMLFACSARAILANIVFASFSLICFSEDGALDKNLVNF